MKKSTIIACLVFSILITPFTISLSESAEGLNKLTLESKKDSCQTYIDLSKLIISLATGVFVLIPSFLSVMQKKGLKRNRFLYFGLIFLIICILSGLLTISALAGTQRVGEYDIATGHIKIISMIQWLFFLMGLALCGLFLLKNMFD